MRTVKIAAVVLCAAAAAGYGLLRLSKARTFQVFGDLVARVATEQKVAALTFDDAPFAADAEVLRLLARERVKATFYCVGANIEKDPAIAAAITAAGHELGNHTWSHKRMVFKTPVFVAREIERTDALIRASGYKGEITFRPPYGKKLLALPWYLSRRGVTSVTCTTGSGLGGKISSLKWVYPHQTMACRVTTRPSEGNQRGHSRSDSTYLIA